MKRYQILPPIILSIIMNFIWYRGLPIYDGDQGTLLANGVNINYLIRGVSTAYTNYPYGFIPVVSSTAWVNLIFVPFAFLGNFGEEVLSTILTIVGSIYLLRLALRYYSYLSSLFSLIIYLTNWYIYEGFIEAPYIFWSQTFIYFLLPVAIYYLVLYGDNEVSSRVAFPIITIIFTFLLASSGEIFPIAWLGFTLLTLYFLRKRIFRGILILLSYTVSQLYWVLPYASVQIPYFSSFNIANSSLTEIIQESSTPLFQSFSSLMPSVTPYSYNIFLTLLISFVVLISFLFAENKDLKFLSLLLIIIVGFDSVIYTPFYPLVKEAVLSNGFFAVLRTTQFATATFAGIFLSLVIPSVIKYSNRHKTKVFAILLVLFFVFNLPVANGSLSDRISIPNYYLQLIQYLNSQPGYFTIAVYPTVREGWYSTTWYYGNNIYLYYSTHPVIVGGIYSGEYFYSTYYELNFLLYFFNYTKYNGNLLVITNLLYLLNVKYIVIEGDAYSNISFVNLLYLPIKPYLDHLNELEENFHLVQFIKSFGPLYLYKVNLNSSYVYFTNVKNISITSMNLTEVLKPANYKWVSSTEIQVPESNYKYVLLTFVYSPYWKSTLDNPINASNFNLYYTGGKEIIIYDALENVLIKDNSYALISLILPIGIGFMIDFVSKNISKHFTTIEGKMRAVLRYLLDRVKRKR